jgi:hypothetical protein
MIMDFIAECSDIGCPEYAVTGVASIERISAGQIQETLYSMRKDGALAVVHVVWDLQAWLHHWPLYEQAREILARMPPPDGPDQERRRERH